MGHGIARAEKRTAEIEAQNKVPVLYRHFPDLGIAAAAHVIDEDVEPAKTLHCSLDQLLSRPFLREVARHRHCLSTDGCEPRGCAFKPSRLDIAEDQTRSLLSQTRGNGLAKAIRRPGHHRDPILYTSHMRSFTHPSLPLVLFSCPLCTPPILRRTPRHQG